MLIWDLKKNSDWNIQYFNDPILSYVIIPGVCEKAESGVSDSWKEKILFLNIKYMSNVAT